jgi:hypothetical protein
LKRLTSDGCERMLKSRALPPLTQDSFNFSDESNLKTGATNEVVVVKSSEDLQPLPLCQLWKVTIPGRTKRACETRYYCTWPVAPTVDGTTKFEDCSITEEIESAPIDGNIDPRLLFSKASGLGAARRMIKAEGFSLDEIVVIRGSVE